MPEFTEALGVDVGTKRIGLARVSSAARLPEPLETVTNDEQVIDKILATAKEFSSDVLVVGLPRNLSGEDTDQTMFSRDFADKLMESGYSVTLQDEALSSNKAEDMIRRGIYKNNVRGKSVSVDEVAACIILNDYIGEPANHV